MRTPSRAFAGTAAALIASRVAWILAPGSGGTADTTPTRPPPPRKCRATPARQVKDNRCGRRRAVQPPAGTGGRRSATASAGNALGTRPPSPRRPARWPPACRPTRSPPPGSTSRLPRRARVTDGAPRLRGPTTSHRWARAPSCVPQRFGDLRPPSKGCCRSASGRAGLARQLVPGTGAAAPEPATLTAAQAEAVAVRGRRRRRCGVVRHEVWSRSPPPTGRGGPPTTSPSVPTDRADPVAYATYVDARDGAVLVGRTWSTRMRTTRSGRSSRTRRRRPIPRATAGCAGASGPTAAATRSSNARLAAAGGSRHRRRAQRLTPPTATTRSAVHNWNSTTRSGRTETQPAAEPRLRVPWTNQWYEESCHPDVFNHRSATTSTRPGPTCSPCTTACTLVLHPG